MVPREGPAHAPAEVRGHLVVTAPTGGSAGEMPARVYSIGEGGRKLAPAKIREGTFAAAVPGPHPNTLRFRMKKLGIQRPRVSLAALI